MTSHMIWTMNVGKLRSLKKNVSGSPLIYASVAVLLCPLIFSLRDELGLVDSLATLGLFNNLLNEAGCWV